MKRSKRFFTTSILLLLILSFIIPGCSGGQANHQFEMAPLSDMSEAVRNAPVVTQEAYQFAVANKDVLTKIPCYCGCGAMGHTSNYSCFVADDSNGELVFDEHALGCSICVDIAQDTMKMLDQGKSVDEIYEIIDNTYSRFGPATPLEQG